MSPPPPTSTLTDAPTAQGALLPLTPVQRFVGVPIGLIYLGFLALLTPPVMVCMTAAYIVVQAARGLGRRRGGARGAAAADERAA